MRRSIAVILIILVVAPPGAVARKQNEPIDWQKLQTLKSGTEIVVWFAGDGVRRSDSCSPTKESS